MTAPRRPDAMLRVGSASKPYRRNVGVVVFNRRGEVLVGERLHYPGVFQFPQGGMDEGETPEAAARRELREETGLALSGPPVHEIADWLRYEFPEDVPPHLKGYRGQEQKWFFYFWDGRIDELDVDHHEREFERLRWANLSEIAGAIVAFKRPVYARLFAEGGPIIAAFLERNG